VGGLVRGDKLYFKPEGAWKVPQLGNATTEWITIATTNNIYTLLIVVKEDGGAN
jgi:hypothetical protein